MNPSESPEVTVQALLALRKENDAVRLITERLRVKEMGPADHIRTKHEVKAFIESGTAFEAANLVRCARERCAAKQTASVRISHQRGERFSQ